jgi:hypothetical protein
MINPFPCEIPSGFRKTAQAKMAAKGHQDSDLDCDADSIWIDGMCGDGKKA